ncbi:MAG: hypothetical protein V3T82_09610, partial [Nitrospinaceae bacterium]
NPALFPLITAAFGSATCLAVYEIILWQTHHRGYALAAWGIILLSPVLYWLVLACNNVVYATCFLMISLYFFPRGDTAKGSTFLVLAALSRGEPFLLIIFVAAYVFWQWKRKEIATAMFLKTLAKLALPPVLWMATNFYKMGNVFYSFEQVQTYSKSTGQNYSGGDFPIRLFELLSTFYFNFPALALGVAGFLFFMKRLRNLRFLYGYTVLSILGYWVLAPFNVLLLQRYLLPISIYLTIFAVLLCQELGTRWTSTSAPLKQRFSLLAILPVLLLPLYTHLPAQTSIDRIILFNKGFDDDIPKVANQLRQKLSESDSRKLKVLVSKRRAAHLNYLLYEYHSRLTISSIRAIYFKKTDFLKEKPDWIVFAPNDLYPIKSALYLFELLSEKGLQQQGMRVGETLRISENTQMVRLIR